MVGGIPLDEYDLFKQAHVAGHLECLKQSF